MPPIKPKIVFCSWEGRPAVLEGSYAWAILSDGEGWTEVNFAEVVSSSRVLSPEAFASAFGPTPALPVGQPNESDQHRPTAETYSEPTISGAPPPARPQESSSKLSPEEVALLNREAERNVLDNAYAILRAKSKALREKEAQLGKSSKTAKPLRTWQDWEDAEDRGTALGLRLAKARIEKQNLEPTISGSPPPKKSAGVKPSERPQGSSSKFSPEEIASFNREAERNALESAHRILRAKTKALREKEAQLGKSSKTAKPLRTWQDWEDAEDRAFARFQKNRGRDRK